ncbi:MAG: cupin domain-containing protein [Mobilicoccus sp.]|nr:cupin domain-containing protein [Mobilicoccus sp.]
MAVDLMDHGPNPHVIDIEDATLSNRNYRTTLWTGTNLQLTVMAIAPGDDIGLEVHDDHDQFLRIEAGRGKVQMGPSKDDLSFEQIAEHDSAVFVPAGSWHNITNVGDEPLKLYSIYAPPEHEHSTVHPTKADDHGHDH